jgi:hypothetical protein
MRSHTAKGKAILVLGLAKGRERKTGLTHVIG